MTSTALKKWEWIKKGVPIRIEIGPRDIETRKVYVHRRNEPVSAKESGSLPTGNRWLLTGQEPAVRAIWGRSY